MMDNAAPHLWVVQVPNINGTSSGRLPQVHRSIGPLRQKQLGQTSNMDVVVIIKVAPPPVIVIIERCLLIFSPQHCIPRMKERKKITICVTAEKCQTQRSFCRPKTHESDFPYNW